MVNETVFVAARWEPDTLAGPLRPPGIVSVYVW
jgi:hypothetical protein